VGDVGLVFALVTVGYMVGVWTGAMVFRHRQRAYEDAVPAAISSPRDHRPRFAGSGQTPLIARSLPSQQWLDAFDWRGPPAQPIYSGPISGGERRLIAASALERLANARLDLDLNHLREPRLEKSL
jgi:hypothetical protein